MGWLLPYFSQTFAKSTWVFCRITALTSHKFDHPEVGGPRNAFNFEYCLYKRVKYAANAKANANATASGFEATLPSVFPTTTAIAIMLCDDACMNYR